MTKCAIAMIALILGLPAVGSPRVWADTVPLQKESEPLAVPVAMGAAGVSSPNDTDSSGIEPQETIDKRIFGVIPNYRTSPSLEDYQPLTVNEKFKIAREDAFDRGTAVLAAAFAGEAQRTDSDPSFGEGVKEYGHYFGTAYADFVIGDYMTEAVFPSLLHQDPRYFRRGTGGVWSRLGYAVGQIFLTHTDTGREAFNYSEIGGNAVAVAISNAYYPEKRNVSSAVSKLSVQIGVDMAANILKEFWPDLSRRFSRKHQGQPTRPRIRDADIATH